MQDGQSQNIWGGRFKGDTDPDFGRFNESFSFDRRLFEVDVRASIAHCDGLVGAEVVTGDEGEQIKSALKTILMNGQSNPKYFDDFPAEDVHSFVESRLVSMIG